MDLKTNFSDVTQKSHIRPGSESQCHPYFVVVQPALATLRTSFVIVRIGWRTPGIACRLIIY